MFNDRFLKACYSQPTDKIPVWFMRQAGRSLPGYRELRKKYDVLTLAQTPELAAQVSLEPVERLGVDAAILFADIMLLPLAMGVELKIVDAVGPVIAEPIADANDIDTLAKIEVGDIVKNIAYLQETIRILRGKLEVPLIGFSGAPFTLASYLIEGKPSRTWTATKKFMLQQPEVWHRLMKTLSVAIVAYLSAQIDAGAQAVQLFDSWVGCLSPADYHEFVLPHVQKIFAALREKKVPRIHFGTNTAGLLADFANVDCEVVGLDWRIDLARGKEVVGVKAIQGNLDPVVLLGGDTESGERALQAKVDAMIASLPSRNGFIFNLGHGILPETDDQIVKRLVEYIHAK